MDEEMQHSGPHLVVKRTRRSNVENNTKRKHTSVNHSLDARTATGHGETRQVGSGKNVEVEQNHQNSTMKKLTPRTFQHIVLVTDEAERIVRFPDLRARLGGICRQRNLFLRSGPALALARK